MGDRPPYGERFLAHFTAFVFTLPFGIAAYVGISPPFPICLYSFCATVITIILLLLVLAVTLHIAADVAATVLTF